MSDEEKTTVEEKTVEEKTEVEETETKERTVEETKTEPVKEVPDAKEETKLGGGDGTKTGTDYGFTYDEVMDFIERHDLPKGLALGDTLNLRLETVTEHGAYDATHIEKSNICVVGMGAVTEADYGEGQHVPPKSDKAGYAMHVGDGVAGTTRYESTEIRESEVVSVYRYFDNTIFIGDNASLYTYFGLMGLLCLLEKNTESDDDGGKKAKAAGDEDSDGYFKVSGVGYATPYRDRPNMHVSIAAKYPLSSGGNPGGGRRMTTRGSRPSIFIF